ncbi:hypothetical protein COLO4_20942 [Corchorus olitorius]|uniref:Uncharacterized protein n=1 Tax=Corchorus olitorius TaxID=93759 RepID=A0A1R3IW02_9ROSI|nr:hypothetical protein COLO4_20942 [Corchorus olitorius]
MTWHSELASFLELPWCSWNLADLSFEPCVCEKDDMLPCFVYCG